MCRFLGGEKYFSRKWLYLYDSHGGEISLGLPAIELNTVADIRCNGTYTPSASQDRWINSIELGTDGNSKAVVTH